MNPIRRRAVYGCCRWLGIAIMVGGTSGIGSAGENYGSIRALKDEARRLQTNLDSARESRRSESVQRPRYESLRSPTTPQWSNNHSNFAAPSGSASGPSSPAAREPESVVIVSHRETPA